MCHWEFTGNNSALYLSMFTQLDTGRNAAHTLGNDVVCKDSLGC